ncbi:MAG: Lrp/AsnC family transcriptional regulator [Thaumarchaeota archaeon]|nr:Lrp/AsnC family transcriptional regulator [Nitrososphaerota archaeon]
MKPLTIKILRSIGLRAYGIFPQDPNVFKPAYLATRLGVDSKTVKAHLAGMERTGFIRFYQVYPNFSHLGIEGSAYLFQSPEEDRRAELIQEIELVEGILEVHNFLGPSICVDLSYSSVPNLDNKLRRLCELTGDSTPVPFYERFMPEVKRPLSKLDWRILKALRYRARRPLREAAAEIGVNLKTFRRRFERMAQEGSFFITPALDPSKAPGLVLFELLVYTTPDADRSTIQRILSVTDDHYVYHYVPSMQRLGNFDILAFAETTGEIEQLRRQVRYIPGVAKVDALVFRGWNEYTKWIDSAIDLKIEQSPI